MHLGVLANLDRRSVPDAYDMPFWIAQPAAVFVMWNACMPPARCGRETTIEPLFLIGAIPDCDAVETRAMVAIDRLRIKVG
jgi:hypothetical protein